MNKCLLVNQDTAYPESENALKLWKTKPFLIKSNDEIKLKSINNVLLHHTEHELYKKLSYINGNVLTVVKCNGDFSVVSVYTTVDCQKTSCLYSDTWGQRELSRTSGHLYETTDSQLIRLIGTVILSRSSLAFKTAVQNPITATEAWYPHLCPVSDTLPCLPIPITNLKDSRRLALPQPSITTKISCIELRRAKDITPGLKMRYPENPQPPPTPYPHTSLAPGDPQPEHPPGAESHHSVFPNKTSMLVQQSLGNLPVAMRTSSTIRRATLMADDEDYDPYKDRVVPHPTTDLETLIHLMKGSLGTGILAMPVAFKSAGLFFGLFATFFVGAVCVYSVHILVESALKLCKKMRVPVLGFDDVAEVAFFQGPPRTRKLATTARFMVNFFLVLDLLGCCCVYIVFVAKNLKQVIEVNWGHELDVRTCMLLLLPFLICMNLIPHLKYLAPFSMVANVLMALGMGIVFYYLFQDMPSVTTRPKFSSVPDLPVFFGTAIFALEGIGVVFPLENNMKTPAHFLGFFGVLNIGMFLVVALYASVGFFGYLKYGAATEASITLNLPDTVLAQSVKLMIALAIFITYSLQFHVPLKIIWKGIRHKFRNHEILGESILRIFLVIMTTVIAVLVPHLGPAISLVGAVCLSFLGLMFPAVVEIVVRWDEGLGRAKWRLWKNIAIILFGLLGFFTGSYCSILDMIEEHKKTKY